MTEHDEARPAERLPEEAAQRLLKRASELEAARSAELSVAELREAAREAGISPGAFEQALAELRTHNAAAPTVMAPVPSLARRVARFWPAALIFAALLSLIVMRLFPTT